MHDEQESGVDPRRPLDEDALRGRLVIAGAYTHLEVLEEVDSTNSELLRRASRGAVDRTVVLAERQTAGRGRLGRTWTAPPRSQIALSVLLRPGHVPPVLLGWLPLVTGLAVRDALVRATGLKAVLKWPNDVLVPAVDGSGWRKIAGILVELSTVRSDGDFGVALPALVVGIGLNHDLTSAELPVPHATSVALSGAQVDRTALAEVLLESLALRHEQWRSCAKGSGSVISPELAQAYSSACSTIGSRVRVELPAGGICEGEATGVDIEGRLLVEGAGGRIAVAAGDVTHVRRVDGSL